jgi:hypothetical protein
MDYLSLAIIAVEGFARCYRFWSHYPPCWFGWHQLQKMPGYKVYVCKHCKLPAKFEEAIS